MKIWELYTAGMGLFQHLISYHGSLGAVICIVEGYIHAEMDYLGHLMVQEYNFSMWTFK